MVRIFFRPTLCYFSECIFQKCLTRLLLFSHFQTVDDRIVRWVVFHVASSLSRCVQACVFLAPGMPAAAAAKKTRENCRHGRSIRDGLWGAASVISFKGWSHKVEPYSKLFLRLGRNDGNINYLLVSSPDAEFPKSLIHHQEVFFRALTFDRTMGTPFVMPVKNMILMIQRNPVTDSWENKMYWNCTDIKYSTESFLSLP